MAFEMSVPSAGPHEASFHIRQVMQNGIGSEVRNQRYDSFADVYDSAVIDSGYNGPRVTAEAAADYIEESKRSSVQILDIGAGTGIVGEELKKQGFINIDALEPSEGMLVKLREKGVYRRCICDAISSEPLNIPRGTYDIITVTGSHGPNHIESSALYEMSRLVKPGGFIIIVTRMENFQHVKEYKNSFFPICEELEKNGKWKKKVMAPFPNYLNGIEGVKFVYEIC